jgi:hypothetical protein
MKKIIFPIFLSIILLACTTTEATPTLRPSKTATLIPPTNTATSNVTPSFTFTPTFIGGRPTSTLTKTPTPSSTFVLVTLPTGTLEPGVVPTATRAGLEGSGFESVEFTETEFHWGACDPNKTTMTVEVTNPNQVLSVVVFVRFKNKSSGSLSGWDDGTAMEDDGGGAFTFIFDGNQMGIFSNSWVVYQLVGTDSSGSNVARSPVIADELSLSPCP